MKDEFNEDYQILNNVQSSIKSFDNKAGILVSVIGIVFGLSLYFLNTFDILRNLLNEEVISLSTYNGRYLAFAIVYCTFFLVAFMSILFSVMVFFPRKNRKNSDKCNVNYYADLSIMDFIQYKDNKEKFKTDEKLVFDQIKTNALICARKHKCLKCSIIFLILFLIFLIALVVLHICFVR